MKKVVKRNRQNESEKWSKGQVKIGNWYCSLRVSFRCKTREHTHGNQKACLNKTPFIVFAWMEILIFKLVAYKITNKM